MARNRKNPSPLNNLSLEILATLKEEFTLSNRSITELSRGYVGISMTDLQDKFLSDGSISRVDYDLALKNLEEHELVGTGPMHAHENNPNSGIFFIGLFSKREYIYIKEEGYKMANNKPKRNNHDNSRQTVNISGGNFYQSPIGAGKHISQQISFDVNSQNDTVNYFLEILEKEGVYVNDQTKSEVKDMVSKAYDGDMKSAKPIFQKIFSAISDPAKEIASGVISGIVTKSLGL